MTPESAIPFAPRWTLRAVLSAALVTAGTFLLLPYLELLSRPSGALTSLRSVDTTRFRPPPPPPPPRPLAPREKPARHDPPKPVLQQMRRRLVPLHAAMSLGAELDNVGGDFDLAFQVSRTDLAGQVDDMVFELSELDAPPRPLARLRPMYPHRARLRKIEGFAVLEFVVSPDGMTRDVRVIASQPGDIFENAAVRAAGRWRFTPGTRDGAPVAVRVRQKVSFKLD